MVYPSRHHLASGVDDALLYTGAGLAIGACYLIKYDMPPVWQSAIFLLVAVVCTERYADRLMALTAMAALLALVFFSALKAGPAGKALMPFIFMTVCTLVYFSVNGNSKKQSLRHYLPVFKVLKIASLVCLYAAGNFLLSAKPTTRWQPTLTGRRPKFRWPGFSGSSQQDCRYSISGWDSEEKTGSF